jgi:hypothetical protein
MSLCGGWFVDIHVDAGLDGSDGWLTMGVTQLKGNKEEGAGAVMWPNPSVDDAAFRRTLPVRLAEKSRTPPRLIFLQNRPGQPASFPHPIPTRLRQ